MPMARMAGGAGARAGGRTSDSPWRAAPSSGAAPACSRARGPRATSSRMVEGSPVTGSLRSTISSPTTRPGRTGLPGREKLARRTPLPTLSADLLLVALPPPAGGTSREGAHDLHGTEHDGQDAEQHHERRQRSTWVPDAEKSDGHGDDAADQVGPPVRHGVVPDRLDDVEDAEHQEGPADA